MACVNKEMGLVDTVLHMCFYFPIGFAIFVLVCVTVFLLNPLFVFPACAYMAYAVVMGPPTFVELEFWSSVRKWIHTKHICPDYQAQFPVEGADRLPPPTTQTLYTFHPHGLLNLTRAIHTLDPHSPLYARFENAYHAVHDVFFRIPFLRELMLCGGCIPASRVYMDWAAARGASITLTPGGAREIQYAQAVTNREVLLFRGRKGYIRFAKRHGLPIVPLYTAGEQDVMTYEVGWMSSFVRYFSEKVKLLTGLTVDLNCFAAFSPRNVMKWFAAGAAENSKPLTVTQVGQPVVTTDDASVEALQDSLLQQLHELRNAAPAAFRGRRLSIH
jgi:2-acylglycerol O-acyltransferase 2